MKKALITGITGQDGSFLSKYLLKKGYEVHGLKRRASSFNTKRIDEFYETELDLSKNLHIHFSDMIDFGNLSKLIIEIQPDEVYHLAAMSHVKVSFDIPLYTAEVNALGTHKLLEAIRSNYSKKEIKFYNASTSELFGKVEEIPQNEKTAFYPRSPYAVSKLYAHWITKHYREAFNIFASNGILFNHESEVRGETFVTRKITRGIAAIALGFSNCILIGNLDAKRDWGYAKEYVELMHKILNYKSPDDWVIGSGNTTSVRDFLKKAFSKINVEIEFIGKGIEEVGIVKNNSGEFSKIKIGQKLVKVSKEYFRPTEVDILIADSQKAKDLLDWNPTTDLDELIEKMIKNDIDEYKIKKIIKDKGYFVSSDKIDD